MTARIASAAAVLLLAATTAAQPAAPQKAKPQKPKPAEAKLEPTDPRPVELVSGDGVLLSGVFYPAEKADRDTPVVVMVADEGESHAVFDRLAMKLQFAIGGKDHTPMSVLAIDLRGQGDSTRVRAPNGEVTDRRGAKLMPGDSMAMVRYDLEAVRRFLVNKNDAGELNLNRTAYLGVGTGGLVALNGAAFDWQTRDLDRGKQGCDVQTLVLVSPRWKWLGLEALPALRQPGVRMRVATLVSYGEKLRNAKSDSQRIVKQLRMDRPDPSVDPPQPAAEASEDQVDKPRVGPRPVIEIAGPSRLQGSDWLKQWGRKGEETILRFLNQTLAKPDFPWVKRRLE